MARSRQKTPITGNAVASSEKKDKVRAHKSLRVKLRTFLANEENHETPSPELNDVSNVYSFSKDGKQYFDVDKYPEMMRK